MAEQPKTMLELVFSITATNAGAKVIKTVATTPLVSIPTAQRSAAQTYLATVMGLDAGLSLATNPGASVTAKQTDVYYQTHDPDSHYARLAGILVTLGNRRR